MNKYIKALVKVTSQYEYAQNFRDGKLWMNELRFFTKCEQKELGDAKEARGTTFSFLNHTYHLINNQDLCRPIFAFMACMIPSMAIPASFLYLKK